MFCGYTFFTCLKLLRQTNSVLVTFSLLCTTHLFIIYSVEGVKKKSPRKKAPHEGSGVGLGLGLESGRVFSGGIFS